MPRIAYIERRFSAASMEIIDYANDIIAEYEAMGFDLTLRQLYYQFVARDLIRNKDSEYKRLGSVINDARLAGLIDWNKIQDRTRFLRTHSSWATPADIIRSAKDSFHLDYWADQQYRPEVWIEKDALVGVIAPICTSLDIPYFSCRGYTSQSEMWVAARRLIGYQREGKTPVVYHLGDHDPSGIDMTRDITDRLEMFTRGEVDLTRLALNMDQVRSYDPPPNPAKLSDSRAAQYVRMYGDDSWELDALSPEIISSLIEAAVEPIRDMDQWKKTYDRETDDRDLLDRCSDRWDSVADFLS